VTPDYNPIIGPAPGAGLYLCTGFSGHGYELSPAAGRLVADLLCSASRPGPAISPGDFRLERFSEGRPLTSGHPYTAAAQMR